MYNDSQRVNNVPKFPPRDYKFILKPTNQHLKSENAVTLNTMPKPSKKESSKKSKSPENKESSVDEHDFIRKQFVEYWKNPRDDKFEKIITKEADSKTKVTGNKPKPKKDFQLTLNLPEYKPEEVLVSTNGNVVEIKGKHQEKDEKGEMQTVRSFIKSFSITEDCDVSQLRSKFEKDGVLTISAPRKTEQ